MVSQGLDTEQAKKVWQPFLDWVARSPQAYSIEGQLVIGSIPAQHMWDVQGRKSIGLKSLFPEMAIPCTHCLTAPSYTCFTSLFSTSTIGPVRDPITRGGRGTVGRSPGSFGVSSRCGCPRRCSRVTRSSVSPTPCLQARGTQVSSCTSIRDSPERRPTRSGAATDTATNPAALTAFALAIAGDAQGSAYPGILRT